MWSRGAAPRGETIAARPPCRPTRPLRRTRPPAPRAPGARPARRAGGGVQQPDRPPVAAVGGLGLDAGLAPGRAQLSRQPVGGPALARRRRRALEGGELADHPLDEGAAHSGGTLGQASVIPRPGLADPDPLQGGGMRAEEQLEGPRGIGVGDVADGQAALQRDVGGGVAGQVEGEGVGAAPPPRARARSRRRRARRTRWPRRARSRAARRPWASVGVAEALAAPEPLGQALREEACPRAPRCASHSEAAQQVVVVLVAELVGHHLEDLVARARRRSGCRRARLAWCARCRSRRRSGRWSGGWRPPGRPRPRPRRRGRPDEHLGAQLAARQPVEAVEERVDDDREEPDGDHADAPPRPRARNPPAAREAADQRQRQQPRRPRRRRRRGPPTSPRPRATGPRPGSRGPRRTARSCATASSGRPTAVSSSEIPAPAAAAPRSGRRARRSKTRRGGRSATIRTSVAPPSAMPPSPRSRCGPRKSSARSISAG